VDPESREPATGEREPHLPPPSLWPLGFAVGIATVLVGLIVNPLVISSVGGAITIVFGFLWIRDATAEYRGQPIHVEPETRELREAVAGAAPPATAGEAAMPPPEPGERFPRSRFLEGATLGLGGLIGGLVTVPVAGLAVGSPFFGSAVKGHDVDLGPLADFPEGQWRIATFMVDPAEGEISRRTAFVRNNGLLNGVPSFTIISNRCAHLGCPVQANGPNAENVPIGKITTEHTKNGVVKLVPVIPAGFGCPCHGGQYDTEGNRTAGPPVRALDRYDYSIVNGRLILGKTYSVSHVDGTGAQAHIHKYKLAGPGQHVDGPEQWFYPLQPPHG
jgi:menaquinol-cytochrome c reductase iron-sulfur subunit